MPTVNITMAFFQLNNFDVGLSLICAMTPKHGFMPEFRIWTIGLQIVRLSRGGHNELGIRTREHLVRSFSTVLAVPCKLHHR